MSTLIIVREFPYWASGKDLPEARKNFRKFANHFPTKQSLIVAYSGSDEDLEKIEVDDMGSVSYPKTVTRVSLQEGGLGGTTKPTVN